MEKFLAHQIGVSVFQWEEGPTVESPGCYVAHTFNFYVMPPEVRDAWESDVTCAWFGGVTCRLR